MSIVGVGSCVCERERERPELNDSATSMKSTESAVLLIIMILKMQNFEKAAARRSEKRSPAEQRVFS